MSTIFIVISCTLNTINALGIDVVSTPAGLLLLTAMSTLLFLAIDTYIRD